MKGIHRSLRLKALVLAGSLVAGVSNLGCNSSSSSHETASLVDSAAVASWRIEQRYSLESPLQQRAEHEFHRVFSGDITDAGAVMVANSGTSELRIFDQNGVYVSAIGRTGVGPGEFRRMTFVRALPGDSIIVYDPGLRRFSLLTPSGILSRNFTIRNIELPFRAVEITDDSRILISVESLIDPQQGEGFRRDSSLYLLSDLTGVVVDTVGRFAGDAWLAYRTPVASQTIRLPFGPLEFVTAIGNHVVSVSAESASLHIHYPNADSEVSRQLPIVSTRISREAVNEAIGAFDIDLSSRGREQISRALMTVVDQPRAVSQLRVDRATRNLWVKLYTPSPADSAVWLVTTLQGETVAHATVPNDIFVLAVRDGQLLVRKADQLGVQRIVLYEVLQ